MCNKTNVAIGMALDHYQGEGGLMTFRSIGEVKQSYQYYFIRRSNKFQLKLALCSRFWSVLQK